ADRVGRFSVDIDDVSVNGRPLADYALADVRRNVVVSEIEPRIFSGVLRYELVPHAEPVEARLLEALEASSALDVLEALDDGLDTWIEERGRSLSGGQRQRLSLARALLADSPVLVLVEPTSAVDTHTEGRIAARLPAVRAGHLTLVASTSPLVLERADRVYLVEGDVAVESGTHAELVGRSAAYRQVVLREEGE
ncbi:MAG TPA: ATP-binding cassette domain-containing protein, partial [Acidimicrobiales bacterium]|nr:ATP-binding cassette domain-containing protein [Acidimicrobiales bacterium]